MGIILDIIIIAILALSTFAGYKKGLVKLGTGLVAGIIAIIITLIAYRPVSNAIINNTSIDEKIENIIIENMTNTDEDNIVTQVSNELIPNEAAQISDGIIYALTGILLFIAVKIILSIIISLLDFVAKLPILKQFNEAGGIAYGLIRGIVIIFICILVVGMIVKINPENKLAEGIENSYITKMPYKNIVKF